MYRMSTAQRFRTTTLPGEDRAKTAMMKMPAHGPAGRPLPEVRCRLQLRSKFFLLIGVLKRHHHADRTFPESDARRPDRAGIAWRFDPPCAPDCCVVARPSPGTITPRACSTRKPQCCRRSPDQQRSAAACSSMRAGTTGSYSIDKPDRKRHTGLRDVHGTATAQQPAGGCHSPNHQFDASRGGDGAEIERHARNGFGGGRVGLSLAVVVLSLSEAGRVRAGGRLSAGERQILLQPPSDVACDPGTTRPDQPHARSGGGRLALEATLHGTRSITDLRRREPPDRRAARTRRTVS